MHLGPVTKKDLDLPSGHNHAEYVNDKGYYDLIQYNLDHQFEFPGLSTIIIGQLGPHITTEVDCESLFSMAGHLSHPNRNSKASIVTDLLLQDQGS